MTCVTLTGDEYAELKAKADRVDAAEQQAAFATANFNRKSEECTKHVDFIREAAEIREAVQIADVLADYDDLKARCKTMVDAIRNNLTCKVGSCPWCGELWPNPSEDGSIERVRELALEHEEQCTKHPIRIERDQLREAVFSMATLQLRRRRDAIEAWAFREIANRKDIRFSLAAVEEKLAKALAEDDQ